MTEGLTIVEKSTRAADDGNGGKTPNNHDPFRSYRCEEFAMKPVQNPSILADHKDATYIGVCAAQMTSDGSIHTGQPMWLPKPAAEAYDAARKELMAHGSKLELGGIMPAGRTHLDQYNLYTHPLPGKLATPGTSPHEKAGGLTVRNFFEAKTVLDRHGFQQFPGTPDQFKFIDKHKK